MIDHGPDDRRDGGAFGDPVDAGLRGCYQDELTVGVERLLEPTLTVGVKGTYRTPRPTSSRTAAISTTPPRDQLQLLRAHQSRFDGHSRAATPRPATASTIDVLCVRLEPGPPRPPQAGSTGASSSSRASPRRSPVAPGELRLLVAARQLRRRRQRDVYGQTTRASTRTSTFPRCGTTRYGFSPSIGRTASASTATGSRRGASPWASRPSPSRARRSTSWGTSTELWVAPSFWFRAARRAGCPRSGGRTSRSRYPIAIGPATVTLQAYLFNIFNKQIAISRDDAWSDSPPQGYPASVFDPNQECQISTTAPSTKGLSPGSFARR